MNKNNYIFYAIIIYIIIISILIITKPDCIYDHNNSKFKQFGYTKDKTMFPIGILSMFIAVIIIILFSFFGSNNDNNNNDNDMNIQERKILQKYQYMMGGNIPNIIAYSDPTFFRQNSGITPIYQQQIYPPQIIQPQIIQPYVRATIASENTAPNVIYQQMPQMVMQQIPQMQVPPVQQVQVPQLQQVQVPQLQQVQVPQLQQ
jgi:hypothetical protein